MIFRLEVPETRRFRFHIKASHGLSSHFPSRGVESYYREGMSSYFPALHAYYSESRAPLPARGVPGLAAFQPNLFRGGLGAIPAWGFSWKRPSQPAHRFLRGLGLGQGGALMLPYEAAGAAPVGPRYVAPYVDPRNIPGYLPPGSVPIIEAPPPGLTPPTITVPAGGGQLVISAPPADVSQPTNPALDAQNQALTNALLGSGAAPSFLSGSTTLLGTTISNTTLALGAGVLLVVLLANRKGRR